MSEQLNLYQKIVKVREGIGNISKDNTAGKGSKFSYDYVSGSQILSKIKEEMNNQNLILTPLIKDKNYKREEITNRYNKIENMYTVELDLSYKWINADKPEETLEIPFYAIGQQSDPSKAFGTALTYSERYVLLKMFNLPTDEDDADNKPIGNQQPRNNQNKSQGQPKPPVQDQNKVLLLQTKAGELSDKLKENGKDFTPQQILESYNVKDIKVLTNEQLIELTKKITSKIDDL